MTFCYIYNFRPHILVAWCLLSLTLEASEEVAHFAPPKPAFSVNEFDQAVERAIEKKKFLGITGGNMARWVDGKQNHIPRIRKIVTAFSGEVEIICVDSSLGEWSYLSDSLGLRLRMTGEGILILINPHKIQKYKQTPIEYTVELETSYRKFREENNKIRQLRRELLFKSEKESVDFLRTKEW